MSKCLLAPQSKKVRSLELSIEEIRQAKDELIRMNNDSTQRELYDMRANSLRDTAREWLCPSQRPPGVLKFSYPGISSLSLSFHHDIFP